jgi:hypothetical protein
MSEISSIVSLRIVLLWAWPMIIAWLDVGIGLGIGVKILVQGMKLVQSLLDLKCHVSQNIQKHHVEDSNSTCNYQQFLYAWAITDRRCSKIACAPSSSNPPFHLRDIPGPRWSEVGVELRDRIIERCVQLCWWKTMEWTVWVWNLKRNERLKKELHGQGVRAYNNSQSAHNRALNYLCQCLFWIGMIKWGS